MAAPTAAQLAEILKAVQEFRREVDGLAMLVADLIEMQGGPAPLDFDPDEGVN